MQQRAMPEVIACIGKRRQAMPPVGHSTTKLPTMRVSSFTRTSFSHNIGAWLEFFAPAPFGRGERFIAQAPPDSVSAANHAAEAISDAFDEFGFTRAPIARVTHHLTQRGLIRHRCSIGLARDGGFTLFHHAIKRHDTF